MEQTQSSPYKWITVALIAALIAFTAVSVFLFFKGNTTQLDISKLRSDLNKFKDNDKLQAARVDSTLLIVTRLDSNNQVLQKRIFDYENSLSSIKTRYDKARSNLTNLPTTDQFSIFAGWVSTPDDIK